MAGTLELSESQAWMPAGWAFDVVLDRLSRILASESPELANMVYEAKTDISGGHLDLRGADAATLKLLSAACERAYEQFASEGPSSFAFPEYYDGFLTRVQELKQMLANAATDREGAS